MESSSNETLKKYSQSRMSPFDEIALHTLLNGKSNLSILEIGSWLGAGSTQILSRYARELVCIDHWEGNDNGDHRMIKEKFDPFNIFLTNTKSLSAKIISIRAASSKCPQILQDDYFDFIFIDGDHRYTQTMQDIEHYLPKLKKKGGVIAGHDCEGRGSDPDFQFTDEDYLKDHIDSPIKKFIHVHPGVIRAVTEKFGSKAYLFADTGHELSLETGETGHSTIWSYQSEVGDAC